MTQFGELSLWIALLMAAWCATLAAQGALLKRASLTQSGARGLCVSCIFAALAAAGLMTAFVGGDYSVRYVATHSGADVETLYKVCAFWSGSAGVLLLASLMAAAAGTAAAMNAMRQDADRARAAWTVAILGLIVGAMLALTVFRGNPFALLPRVAGDGRGLDPIFRNPAMAVQPPLLLLGLVGAAVPVALVIAGVVRRDFDGAFVARVRAWALVSWALLTIAFLLGAHWSYTSPGLRARAGHSGGGLRRRRVDRDDAAADRDGTAARPPLHATEHRRHETARWCGSGRMRRVALRNRACRASDGEKLRRADR